MQHSIEEGIAAAREGSVGKLSSWLLAGGDPNAHDAAGWTPLLWGAARGHADAVEYLLAHLERPADPAFAHRESGALPIHMAGQAGSVPCAGLLLDRAPELIDAVLDINAHTPLLQATFYGHLALAEDLLKRGADTALTTARGLGPLELAAQFQNQPMVDLLRPYDRPAEEKAANYKRYLERIAPVIPPDQRSAQELADRLVAAVSGGIARVVQDHDAADEVIEQVRALVADGADVNRLGGPLQQPPLIAAVTGNNGSPAVPEAARLRRDLANLLLDHGADPLQRERHPMGAQTIIRGAVFNHLDILKDCARSLTPQELADAINEVPAVNGLTAMHDTVLRATMAGPDRFPSYVDQARWFVQNGGRVDIEDFSGTTQRDIADRCDNPEVRAILLSVLDGHE